MHGKAKPSTRQLPGPSDLWDDPRAAVGRRTWPDLGPGQSKDGSDQHAGPSARTAARDSQTLRARSRTRPPGLTVIPPLSPSAPDRPVRRTFCRSAVNAERTRDRTTAARSRGRQPAASRHGPRSSEPRRRSAAATACWTGRRSLPRSLSRSHHACPGSASFSGPTKRCSRSRRSPHRSMSPHHRSHRTGADVVTYTPQSIYPWRSPGPPPIHQPQRPRSAVVETLRPSRPLSNVLALTRGRASARRVQRLVGQPDVPSRRDSARRRRRGPTAGRCRPLRSRRPHKSSRMARHPARPESVRPLRPSRIGSVPRLPGVECGGSGNRIGAFGTVATRPQPRLRPVR